MVRWTLFAALALVALATVSVAGSPAYDIDDEALLAEVNGQPLPSAHARTRVEALMTFDDLPADALALLEETAHDNPIAASLVRKQKDEPKDSTDKDDKSSSDKSSSEKSSGEKKRKSKRGQSKRTEKDEKKSDEKSDEKKSDEKKSGDKKSDEKKSDEKKSDDKKSDDKKSDDKKADKKKDGKDEKDKKSSSLKKDDAKVDEKSTASNSTATASADKKQANPVAPIAASDNAVLNATGPVKGVDNWTTVMGRGVYSAPTGVVIGTIPAKAELVIEYYAYEPSVKDNSTGRSSDETLWGWGYVTSPEGFGGWAGENACGFFPLQRRSGSDLTGPLTLQATRGQNVPNHPTKCPKMADANKQLQLEKILKQGSYLKSGGLVKAITSKTCQTHTNYDPAMKSTHGPSIPIEAGTYSGGLLPVGTVPTSTPQKKMVENFGLRYVTKDGKMALISYPLLDPAQPGLSDFFVPLDCIEFDAAAITNANKLYVPKAAPSVVAQAQAKAKKAAAEAKAKAEKEKQLKAEEAKLKKKLADRLKKHRKNKKSKSKKGKSRRKHKGKSSRKNKRGGKKHDAGAEEEPDSKPSSSKNSHSNKSMRAKNSKGKKGKHASEDEEDESSSKKKSHNKKGAKKSSKKDDADGDEDNKSDAGKKSKSGKADNDEREEKNERKPSGNNRRTQSSFLETETEAEADEDAEQEDAAETDAEEESEFVDDATLMEVAASTHASLSNDGPRGDYPGWSEMLLEESASVDPIAPIAAAPTPIAPLSAVAAPVAPAPVMQAAPAPAAAVPASTIKLGETQTEAVLKNASVGIKKVNVHVYGQPDPSADAEKELRLQGMVQRLARNQSASYQKINDLLRKLKACGAENKACIAQLTEKLEDWKQENVAPK